MSDQQELAPDNVVTSVTWNMAPTVKYVIDQVSAGSYTAQDLKDFSMVGKGGQRWPRSTRTSSVVCRTTSSARSRSARPRSRRERSESTSPRPRRPDPRSRTPRLDGAGWPGVTTDAPALELRGITKRFGDLVANDGIDFDVRRGEGPRCSARTAAGKTTVMRIAYGLTHRMPVRSGSTGRCRPSARRATRSGPASGWSRSTSRWCGR